MKLGFPILVDTLSTLKDGSIKVTMHTRELSGEDAATLFNLRNKEGYAVLAETLQEADQVEIPEATYSGVKKTPSQRLRSVIYVRWEQLGSSSDFNKYYEQQIELIIDKYKERLS
jgi:hypothetical protein